MSALDPSNWEAPLAVEGGDAVLDVMYPLHVMNSLTRTKTRFIPRNPAHITWYQCGPTVYAESHMGHARTYVSLDVIRRVMKEFLGYNLVLCQNITDIDDKIIIRSSERKMPFRDLSSKYEADFFDDMAKLGVAPPDMITRVSEYMPEIVDYILTLCEKGVAYESNGSVYFDTNGYQACGHVYGKLVPEQIETANYWRREREHCPPLPTQRKTPVTLLCGRRPKTRTLAAMLWNHSGRARGAMDALDGTLSAVSCRITLSRASVMDFWTCMRVEWTSSSPITRTRRRKRAVFSAASSGRITGCTLDI